MLDLAWNGIATVTLTNLLHATDKSPLSATLSRKQAPIDLVYPLVERVLPEFIDQFADPFPERRQSSLPAPGDSALRAALGEYLGHGHSSVVYALKDVDVSGTSGDITAVPPLVVKIARLNRVTSVMKEAWMYDEMECLQGVAIPRCYGWFEMELGQVLEDGYSLDVFAGYPSSDWRDDNPILDIDFQVVGKLSPLMQAARSRRDLLSVLVLERLGPKLPLGRPVSQKAREEMLNLFVEIGHLCINNVLDIRYDNILQAPSSPPALPSLPSPFTHRTYGWRLIDFEMALKVNHSAARLSSGAEDELVMVWDDAEEPLDDDSSQYGSNDSDEGEGSETGSDDSTAERED